MTSIMYEVWGEPYKRLARVTGSSVLNQVYRHVRQGWTGSRTERNIKLPVRDQVTRGTGV